VLNQNYHWGWRIGKGKSHSPAIALDGLIAAPVKESDKTVIFYYLPTAFLFGLLVTLLTLLIMAKLYKNPRWSLMAGKN
jgi:hypothetical protein